MRQDTREQIFEFLQDYQRQNGFAPTVRGETLDIPGFAAIANALADR